VLLSFSTQNAILDKETSGLLLIVVALSMLLTPILLILNEKIIQPLYSRIENIHPADEINETDNQVIMLGAGRFGVVLGRFLKANGIGATVLDSNPDSIQVLRKFGFKVYYGDSNRHDLLKTAGIENARVLIIALDDKERITEIAEYAKSNYPHLRIFARAIDVPHSFELSDLEIDGIRRETYDSSIHLGVQALQALGFNKYLANRSGRAFRYHDQIIMSELHKMWHEDEKHYILQARKFAEQIENILMAEQEIPEEDIDHAWDSSSRREEVREMFEQRDQID
jgi:voltage-gated potassium channel Kch